MTFSDFENKIGVNFKDKGLLKQAFTHRSYINENRSAGLSHNERLEFLGDAVLELTTTKFLYEKYPDLDEGALTAIRSALVNADACAEVAQKLGVNDLLLLSKGESKDEGRARLYILANTLEALIGAIYLDQGYGKAEEFIFQNITPLAESVVAHGTYIDAKSLFQSKAQEYEGITPMYKTVDESGPDHDKHFRVAVFVGNAKYGEGDGKSKQDAEQDAARNALQNKDWN